MSSSFSGYLLWNWDKLTKSSFHFISYFLLRLLVGCCCCWCCCKELDLWNKENVHKVEKNVFAYSIFIEKPFSLWTVKNSILEENIYFLFIFSLQLFSSWKMYASRHKALKLFMTFSPSAIIILCFWGDFKNTIWNIFCKHDLRTLFLHIFKKFPSL